MLVCQGVYTQTGKPSQKDVTSYPWVSSEHLNLRSWWVFHIAIALKNPNTGPKNTVFLGHSSTPVMVAAKVSNNAGQSI